jgi:hypothetical protein
MADSLGPVPIPDPPVIGAFPLKVDYGSAKQIEPSFWVHQFDQPGLKTEQRFYRGAGGLRFRVRKQSLECHEYEHLRDHWNQAKGIYAAFPYSHPETPTTTVQYTVRYGDPVLRFEHLVAHATGDPGITLVTDPGTANTLTYSSFQVIDGRPTQGLLNQLLNDRQQLIPLVTIYPRDGSTPLKLSDRRVVVDGAIYLPRLIDWSGLTQSANQNNDSAQFRMGNADNVWTTLFKTLNLFRARVVFSIYVVAGGYRLDYWTGYVRSWSKDPSSRQISVSAGEGAFEFNLPYPTRQISRTCWKEFKGPFCPYVGPLTTCPKSWEACKERGMTLYHGGVQVKPQDVNIANNSSGTLGWGKSVIKSVTLAEESVYQRTLQEIYTDIPMIVPCDVALGRDDSEFYAAVGILGEGPITGFSTDLIKHLLDDVPPHDPQKNGGFRGVRGLDPSVATYDFFAINQAPWNQAPPNSTYAAGVAFAEIRRTDAEGLQLSKVADHKISVMVTGGLGGWTWTAPGARVWTEPLTNCVWVAVNAYLRGLGLKADFQRPYAVPMAEMESWLDLPSIIAAATICDTVVPKLIGTGNERQFPFRGILKEQKPLRDWLTEILTNCLGYYYYVNGKLAIGIRVNSSVLANNAFTRATVIQNSFSAEPREASFNHLTAEFGDEEYEWSMNTVQVYDIDHAKMVGTSGSPRFMVTRLSLVGCSNKSQASRITMVRLKEELGGGNPAEQLAARGVRLKSTVIALATMPGDVGSFDDPDLPGGRIEFRITSRTLNPDWSMDFEAVPSTDSMYNEAIGPKPDDVKADPVPAERFPGPRGLAWFPNTVMPFAGDPIYTQDKWTFALWQDYTIARTGVWDAALWVRGEMEVNKFLGYDYPMIYDLTWESGGSLPGGTVYYVAICQRDATFGGHYTQPSNIVATWVPFGMSVKLKLNTIVAAPGYPGYAVYMGTDVRRMCKQINSTDRALPPSLEINVHYKQTDAMPWAEAKKVRIKAKRVEHSGVAGIQVQEVVGNNQIRSSEWIGSTDNWIGQYLSVLADWSDGAVPLWNFRITAFDPATGTITVDPPCVRADVEDSVEALDVMVVRARPSASTADTVTCSLWRNSIAQAQFGADGLEPGAEVGLMLRILEGKGKGQTRLVVANTNDTHTVDVPWDDWPDSTSILIVEQPDWVYTSETSTPSVDEGLQYIEIRTRVSNLQDRVVLVGGFLVDDAENETYEEFGVYREIYVFGQPPTVREDEVVPAGSERAGEPLELYIEDQTVRVQTEAGITKDVKLPAHYAYFGRTLRILNEGGGSVRLLPPDGVHFSNGDEELVLEANEMIEITAV